MSEYFDATQNRIVARTLAKSADINGLRDEVGDGFDLVPDSTALNTDTGTYCAESGVADAYVLAMPVTQTVFTTGMQVTFIPGNENTGASTVDVDGLGAKNILRPDGTALEAGDLLTTQIVALRYNGTEFMFSGSSPKSYLAAASVSAAAALVSEGEASDSAVAAAASAVIANTRAGEATISANAASLNADDAATDAGEANDSAVAGAAALVTCDANVALTEADVVSTNADVVSTNADALATAADAVSTAADAVSTAEDAVLTEVAAGLVVQIPKVQGNISTRIWTQETNSTDQQWVGSCWSPDLGLFVAVSLDSGNIMYSFDGINWTAATTVPAHALWGVAWSSSLGLFAAVGNGGVICTSPDGDVWTARTSPVAGAMYNIVWSPEEAIFVAVGSDCAYSTNGTTWTEITNITNQGWGDVAWSAELGLFVAVASTYTTYQAASSPDGINWTDRTGVAGSWQGVGYSPELQMFVAVGMVSGNRIMVSYNGTTWSDPGNVIPTNQSWRDVGWSPELGLFVIIASTNTAAQQLWTSWDGLVWTKRYTPEVGGLSSNFLHSVSWSPELMMFVAVAQGGTTGRVVRSA